MFLIFISEIDLYHLEFVIGGGMSNFPFQLFFLVLNEVLQVEANKLFTKSSHFTSLSLCFIIFGKCKFEVMIYISDHVL
jgi:hypothetical protein